MKNEEDEILKEGQVKIVKPFEYISLMSISTFAPLLGTPNITMVPPFLTKLTAYFNAFKLLVETKTTSTA